MVRLATMNLTLRGLPNVHILKRNALTTTMDKTEKSELGLPLDGYDVVLANPPFSGSVDRDRIVDDVKVGNTTSTELLFLKYMLNTIKKGGRCGVVVPEGVLTTGTNAHKELRRQLVEGNTVEAVMSLPGGVFQPYSGVKTSVIFFKRGGKTDKVLFLNVQNDGYKLDSNHDVAIESDDLPLFLNIYRDQKTAWKKWNDRDELSWDENWWFTDIEEIKKNDLNLSVNRYKPKQKSTKQFESPINLINELSDIEKTIQDKVNHLKSLLQNG
jgi:type I restriction enzyme M protein